MLEKLSDKALLVADDEHAAFRVLYERYWEPLYKKGFCRLGNSADAQDAVQEVFISLWRNRATIVFEQTLSPYLFTALKYSILKQVYRKTKKGLLVPLSAEELEHTSVDTEELLQYRELQAVIETEVASLPGRMREIYRLSRMENLQIAEIAGQLNLSEQTVKNTLSTALKRLREKLSHYCWSGFFL
ncbi:MAG TPA: sigma-70 family RNA polymerase sigma factor [Flavisolibacter sp.]|nr:sigma-70 family RNA polymerase sigma factor [Flavisolibacter sp.]